MRRMDQERRNSHQLEDVEQLNVSGSGLSSRLRDRHRQPCARDGKASSHKKRHMSGVLVGHWNIRRLPMGDD